MNPDTHQSRFRLSLAGKRVVVMGLGRFGGGLGITRWLAGQGTRVLITDAADAETLSSSITQLGDLLTNGQVQVVHGPHSTSMLDDADVLVVNPAVAKPWDNAFVKAAQSRGVEITTEIELAYRQLDPSRVIAVTGSAGKSTTSAMIHHTLCETGYHSMLGGNIGGSLLTRLDEITAQTIVVLELSSAMLHWLWGTNDGLKKQLPGPAVGCVTNCTSNHLDWHGDEQHYQASKELLPKAIAPDGRVLLGESLMHWQGVCEAKCELITENGAIENCVIPGKHNAINAAMAVRGAMAITGGGHEEKMVEAVRCFSGLPHRLNRCHESNGVMYFNDSKSTTPQATCLAVDAVSEQIKRKQIHLICGGYDKGSDLSSISSLRDQIAQLYTIGDTGKSLAQSAQGFYCASLDAAVKLAIKQSNSGDAVVLSPGCASWDQFTNYEQRGEAFESLVRKYTERLS